MPQREGTPLSFFMSLIPEFFLDAEILGVLIYLDASFMKAIRNDMIMAISVYCLSDSPIQVRLAS